MAGIGALKNIAFVRQARHLWRTGKNRLIGSPEIRHTALCDYINRQISHPVDLGVLEKKGILYIVDRTESNIPLCSVSLDQTDKEHYVVLRQVADMSMGVTPGRINLRDFFARTNGRVTVKLSDI